MDKLPMVAICGKGLTMTTIWHALRQADGQSNQYAFPCSFSGTAQKSLALTGLFGSFVFLQFTVLGLANHAGEGYLTNGQRDLVYYALQVFVILGFLLHALYSRFCAEKRIRNVAANTVCGLLCVCVTWMLAAGTDSLLNVITSMMAALCVGGIGGAVHCRMSREAAAGARVARSMGLGSTAAVVLQYLLQIRQGVSPLLPVFMGAAFLLLLFMLGDRNPGAVNEKVEHPKKTKSCRLVSSVLIASAFILFACFYNESIHHLMIQSDYAANVYSWPRLMMVPVYLLFAVTGVRKNGKYVPIVSLCIMLIALLNVVLMGNSGAYWLNMCFFYFGIATYTCYYLLIFWRLAPGTRHPAFWAPFGRMLDSAMVLFTGAIHLSELSVPLVLGLDIAGLALVILLMAISGDFNLSAATEAIKSDLQDTEQVILPGMSDTISTEQEGLPSLTVSEYFAATPELLPLFTPDEALERMQARYNLTQRETEVLRELVLTEDKQTVISERLSIQPRTLQNHVTRLYRKTGTATRAGLTELFHGSRLRE